MTIEISNEDYEFLKELQHELNTQTTDGNAQPVFWGVMETHDVAVPDGCGTTYIQYDDGKWNLEESVHVVEEYIESLSPEEKSHVEEEWGDVDKGDIGEVYDFMDTVLKWDDISMYDYCEEEKLSTNTGAFLTKRACKQYIDKYRYNHRNPHTYAMTAFRNFELERLLNILKKMNFK